MHQIAMAIRFEAMYQHALKTCAFNDTRRKFIRAFYAIWDFHNLQLRNKFHQSHQGR